MICLPHVLPLAALLVPMWLPTVATAQHDRFLSSMSWSKVRPQLEALDPPRALWSQLQEAHEAYVTQWNALNHGDAAVWEAAKRALDVDSTDALHLQDEREVLLQRFADIDDALFDTLIVILGDYASHRAAFWGEVRSGGEARDRFQETFRRADQARQPTTVQINALGAAAAHTNWDLAITLAPLLDAPDRHIVLVAGLGSIGGVFADPQRTLSQTTLDADDAAVGDILRAYRADLAALLPATAKALLALQEAHWDGLEQLCDQLPAGEARVLRRAWLQAIAPFILRRGDGYIGAFDAALALEDLAPGQRYRIWLLRSEHDRAYWADSEAIIAEAGARELQLRVLHKLLDDDTQGKTARRSNSRSIMDARSARREASLKRWERLRAILTDAQDTQLKPLFDAGPLF